MKLPAIEGSGVTTEPRLYFLQNKSQGFVGNSPVFWHKSDSGYTPWLDDAKQMTLEETEQIIRSTRGSHRWHRWPVDELNSIARRTVDIQDMREAFNETTSD